MKEKARTVKESREPFCANERGRKTSLDEERGVVVSCLEKRAFMPPHQGS